MHGVDGTGEAGGDLRRAGDGTADDAGKSSGFQRLASLLRVMDMPLGDDLCRAFRGQLVDKLKINIVDSLRLGGVAAHGGAHKVGTGLGAGHGVLKVVAVGHHQIPLPFADVVTTTTHKTLRGPRGGMILSRDEEFAKKLNSAVFPGTQGGPLMHVIAGKAICLREAAQPEFRAYAENVVKNAKALAEALLAHGFDLVTGGTDNHLMLADLRKKNITGKELQTKLDEVHITVNKNAIPNDPEKPFVTSGVRVGTPAVTSRGFKEPELVQIALWIGQTARDFDTCREQVRSEVDALCRKFPIYQ